MTPRIAFLGTGNFAVPPLRALAQHCDLALVITSPPQPAGRGRRLCKTPVALAADELTLPLETAAAAGQIVPSLQKIAPDLGIVVDFGMRLPTSLLDTPRLGFLNLHPSLLPRWRGAAPIPRAILAGDPETGVSVLRVTEKLDAGPVAAIRSIPLGPRDSAGQITGRLARLGAELLVETVLSLAEGRAVFTEQDPTAITAAPKIPPGEERIDWRRTAAEIRRHILALSPHPGSWCLARDERLRLLDAEEVEGEGPPGTVLDDRFTVACGEGAVRILSAQRPGRRPIPAVSLLRGFAIAPGDLLG